VTNQVINQIGQGGYYSGILSDPQMIEVDAPIEGQYRIDAIGAGAGPYTIRVLRGNEEGIHSSRVVATGEAVAGVAISSVSLPVSADVLSPTLKVPGSMLVNATGPTGVMVSYDSSASDAVDGPVAVDCAPLSGTVFPIGDTTVNCTATDRAGNGSSGTFTVHVKGAVEQLNDLWLAVIESLANFDPASPRQRKLACASMSLFISLVRVHSGRTIPQSRANELIADANRIRAVLGC
jgi:hypothetical protein